MISLLGTTLAILGSLISIAGAIANNCWHEHHWAMRLWMVSNVLLLAWSIGFVAGYWNGGLSGAALVGMYAVFAVTNAVGLARYKTCRN